jgi:hypothetical protein
MSSFDVSLSESVAAGEEQSYGKRNRWTRWLIYIILVAVGAR